MNDLSGRLVHKSFSGNQSAGTHTKKLPVNNFAKGIYFILLKSNSFNLTKKLIICY